jgi:hypothetical protein
VWSWDAYIYHVKPPESMPLNRRMALAAEKGAMAARFVRKSPSVAVRLATGAYGANFVRSKLADALGLRRFCARVANGARASETALGRWCAGALVDGAYLDALQAALRRSDG